MTRGEITTRVQQWFGLQQMDDYDELPLIHDLIYRGTVDLLTRTRCVARCVHMHYSAGEGVYTLDHNILALIDVDDGSVVRARRDQTGGANNGVVGTVVYPDGYIASSPFTFTLVRSDLLRMNPTPSEDGELDVWAVLLPQEMPADTNSPGEEAYGAIPEEFQDAIELYTLWKASDYGDDASGAMGERYRVLYEGPDGRSGRLALIRQLVNKRGTARAPARRVRMRSTGYRRLWVG